MSFTKLEEGGTLHRQLKLKLKCSSRCSKYRKVEQQRTKDQGKVLRRSYARHRREDAGKIDLLQHEGCKVQRLERGQQNMEVGPMDQAFI